jgi:hypothetical protein
MNRRIVSLTLLFLVCVSSVRAGLTVDIHSYHYPGYAVAYGWLSTNATPPAAPQGDYVISSPNGSNLRYRLDGSGLNYLGGGGLGTSDFSSFMNALTNGQWSIQVTNTTSTNTYYFNVSATGLSSNLFNPATIAYPATQAQNVDNDPTFTWFGGPQGWLGTIEATVYEPSYSYYESASLPPSATSWNTPNPPLPLGTNLFHLVYLSNATAAVVASVPRDAGANPISGWISTASLEVNSAEVEFVVGLGHAFDAYLVGRYDFEDTNNVGRDTSGQDNDSNCSSGSGPQVDTASTNAAIHSLARQFFGETSYCFYPGSTAHGGLSNALHGNFSVTAWIKTTNSVNSDFANAYFGMPILFAYSSNTNGTVPLSITGSKAAFTVSNPGGTDTTLHSTTTVNDGNYHFLAVTRNATNGLMSLYVDGQLEATDNSTPQPFFSASVIHLCGGSYNYQGLLDDVRLYATELAAADVALLANVPTTGATLTAHYTFDNPSDLGEDSSPNHYHLNASGVWNGGDVFDSTDAIAGGGAAEFDSAGGNGGGFLSYNPAPPGVLSALSGNFSVSIWVKTVQSLGNAGDPAWAGAAVVSADVPGIPGLDDDLIPIALTDGEVAFNTGGSSDHTVNSSTTVNNGNYHHLVVTRQQATGEKKIYIDGVLDSTATDEANVLNSPALLTLGAKMDASQTDPANGDPQNGYEGWLDDLQIYSSVLSPSQVAYLFSHPGNIVGSAGTLAESVNATNLVWATSGETNWFPQTGITHDGVAAARSGAIGNNQFSTIRTIIYGTNVLTFWWKVDSEENSDYLEFYDNGNFVESLSGNSGWQQYAHDLTDPGQHVLEWTFIKDGSGSSGQDAAFLDEVSLAVVPPRAPVNFSLRLIREQRAAHEDFAPNQVYYIMFPFLDSPGSTFSQHRVESPGGTCHGLFGPTNDYSSSSTYISGFNNLANELTNGNWKLWLNKDTPQEEFYTFTISAASFGSNSLTAFAIFSPTNGGTGIPSNPAYQWQGLTGWDELSVQARQPRYNTNHYYSFTSLTPTLNTWTGVPPLADGTNIFEVKYAANNRNADLAVGTPFSEWSVDNIRYESSVSSGFVVSGSTTPPPNLSIVFTSSNTVAVSWPSPSTGFGLHSNTNLATPNWTAVGLTPADNGITKTVVIQPPVGDQFFKLVKPIP